MDSITFAARSILLKSTSNILSKCADVLSIKNAFMKNITTLIFMIKLLIINSLMAQIEVPQNDFAHMDSKIGPLSINGIFEENSKKKTIIFDYDSLSNPKIRTDSINYMTSNSVRQSKFAASDTFNKKRFWSLVGTGVTIQSGALLLLNNVWYAQYPRSSFHYFDDQREWLEIDKAGHILTAYTASKWAFNGIKWSGMKNKNAAIIGMSTGMLFQTSLEFLDGFSKEWGFSWADMLSNASGCALFGFQQAVWDEQRIILKISNTPRNYSNTPILSTDGTKSSSLRARATDLYGDNYTQTFFKDYNALSFWLSVNPRSFMKNSTLPTWLNIAVGYGADNMYGGYNNAWPTSKPDFVLSDKEFPRYRQMYLSLDVDLSKIKTKSKFVNALLRTINFIKIPSPTLEFNSLNQLTFHPFFF
jgi:hypothetical protein